MKAETADVSCETQRSEKLNELYNHEDQGLKASHERLLPLMGEVRKVWNGCLSRLSAAQFKHPNICSALQARLSQRLS